VLVVGGSPGMSGAVCLAAAAAFRSDAGYVAVATHPETLPVVEARVLEAVKAPLEDVDRLAERAGAVALGPGLGRGDDERALVRRLLHDLAVPVVVDADALFALEPGAWPAPRVLTPHSGELGRLLDRDDVDKHRLECVQAAADRFGCVVLLKGADTLVAAPDGRVCVSHAGVPGLATAGSGDVLTGVVAAMLAREPDAWVATAAAAEAHGAAGRAATERLGPSGIIATDVIEALPGVLR
jgi:ADP-dependent NAD(P)H-hydrate dehydratase / NAD(P)H-hydrate epimerase